MKKIFMTIVAVAAIAACSKTEVQYENSAEISFAPVKGNVTKVAGLEGALANTQKLGVWAFWDKDGAVNEAITNDNVANYDDNYLVNALFAHNGSSWGGSPTSYPWPISGSLFFAGYTTPNDSPLTTDTKVSYNKTTDIMTFSNYTYSKDAEFDLCWFGRTNSYNYRAEATATPVTAPLSHALTWVTIAVYGEGTPVGNWKITSITLDNINVSGTAACNGQTKKATWNPVTATTSPVEIFSGEHTIAAADSNGDGVELTNNVLIPTKDVQLTFNYSFSVNGQPKTDSKSVTLNTTTWESGVHYTYTLVIKANEILVAPSYGTWTVNDQSVTVE